MKDKLLTGIVSDYLFSGKISDYFFSGAIGEIFTLVTTTEKVIITENDFYIITEDGQKIALE